jgi:hypothetical protein
VTAAQEARDVALDGRLSFPERRRRITELASRERRRLGVDTVPGVERYLNTLDRVEEASTPLPVSVQQEAPGGHEANGSIRPKDGRVG